jgi:hypothetical protein
MAGTSFRQGSLSLKNLAELPVSAKQVERVVRRIGGERCAQRDAAVEAFVQLPLAEKTKAPPGVTPPKLAVVMADGGRLQILDRRSEADDAKAAAEQCDPASTDAVAAAANAAAPLTATLQDPAAGSTAGSSGAELPPLSAAADEESDAPVQEPGSRSKHWREDKVGILLEMSSPQNKNDPCPEIPAHFIEPRRIEKLTRELKAKARRKVPPPERRARGGRRRRNRGGRAARGGERKSEPGRGRDLGSAGSGAAQGGGDPTILAVLWANAGGRSVVAGVLRGEPARLLGRRLERRVGAVAAALLDIRADPGFHSCVGVRVCGGGRTPAEGWVVYERWIAWIWQGHVAQVIAEIAARLHEVGLPETGAKEGNPGRVLQEALTFLENHQGQMKYAEYRQQGLPITTSHIESEIKRINLRVKGTEKFWSEEGAEYILQLRADYLSDDKPMDTFWQQRESGETGQRRYRKHS